VRKPGFVGVGSTRAPKVAAVCRALARLAELHPALAASEVVPRDVGALAPAMPLSLDVMLDGARARAEAALRIVAAEVAGPVIGIGLEGGIDVRGRGEVRRGYLMSWAYVTDGDRGCHGCGGALEVPRAILESVVDRGEELSEAIDRFAGEADVRSRQGAWGVLTRGLVERTESFALATINALTPFYNSGAYPPG
jgi:non-canonical (house-cleaning) NTP pyrophosphatase